jgi:hypothetical protein
MNLRQSLKADFGIEVLVEGGSGLPDDPFVIEPCSAMEATRTQLNLLRGLERGRGELWRIARSVLGANYELPGSAVNGEQAPMMSPGKKPKASDCVELAAHV